MHRTIDGTTYATVPNTDSCRSCAAYGINGLCHQLRRTEGSTNYCLEHSVTWCNTERPTTVPQLEPAAVKGRVTTPQELQLFIRNYQQLAKAVQRAGGLIEILETHTVPQLLETLARNNITIKATCE